jgi:3-hydroxybutyryl-CoA dehydrogenase
MGHGIAHAAIACGYETSLYDVSDAAAEKGRVAIEQLVRKGVELAKISAGDAGTILRRLSVTTSLRDALDEVGLVIEAAPERIDLKLALFAQIEQLAPSSAIIASNTSALSITEMAGSLKNPGRVAGMHFFNPVHKMRLIEMVQALESAPATLQASATSTRR